MRSLRLHLKDDCVSELFEKCQCSQSLLNDAMESKMRILTRNNLSVVTNRCKCAAVIAAKPSAATTTPATEGS